MHTGIYCRDGLQLGGRPQLPCQAGTQRRLAHAGLPLLLLPQRSPLRSRRRRLRRRRRSHLLKRNDTGPQPELNCNR